MSTRKRQAFSPEFKQEAVRLLEQGDKEATQLARELGIKRNQLYKWQEQYDAKGDSAFGGSGRPAKDSQSELARLRQENIRLQEENEILKKAAVFFAKEVE